MADLLSSPAIAYLNLADGRTITASSSAAGYPASRLSNSLLSESWRSVTAALTSITIDADLGSSQDIDIAALVGVNLEDDHTRRLQLDDSATFATVPNDHDSTLGSGFDVTLGALMEDHPSHGRNLIYFPGETINSRYARFTLNDTGNPDNHLRASVLWAGPVWQAETGMQWDWELVDDIVGSPGVEAPVREWKLAYKLLTEAEARELRSILRNKLRSGRYLIVPHPTDTTTLIHEAIYATLSTPARILPQPTYPRTYSVEMVFRETIG